MSWRVDYTLSSSELREVNEPLVHLNFHVRDGERGRTVTIPMALSADKFRVLLAGEARGGVTTGTPGPRGLLGGMLQHLSPPHCLLPLPSELKQAQALMNTLL